MEPIINTYTVKVIREPGESPLTGQSVSYDEESFEVDTTSVRSAYSFAHLVCTLQFKGQLRRTYINGEEYFYEQY